MSSSLALIGTSIGHIRIAGQLGEGGMGEVYVGIDETLQRRVAIKAIRAEHRLDPVARARLLREARILSQLDDPHICRIYDYVQGDEADFIVLELIEGRTLTPEVTRSLSPSARLDVAGQLAAVLATAHEQGIVHRDLKPANVMLTASGLVKVLDFGIAQTEQVGARGVEASGELVTRSAASRWIDSASDTLAAEDAVPSDPALTVRGTITGSAGYMSPEQARGEPVTTASDLYSFGLLLQELFTGRPPYPAGLTALELVSRASRAESLPAEGIDADLARLITRMKNAAPAARPTALDVVEHLHQVRDKPKRRRRRLVVVAALCLIALGAFKYTTDLRVARNEAERRRGQAEDLISFMLGDLREKLAAVGRLEILDETGAKALSYFDSLPVDDQRDEDLMRRAKALAQIGEVRVAKGDPDGALAVLADSLALANTAVSGKPARTEWLATLGATHFWIGYARWNKGDLTAALEQFTAYRAMADQMVRLEPSRPEWKLELAQAETNLGALRQAQGRLAEASEHFRTSVALKRDLVAADPANSAWKQDLANSLSWLGDSLRHQGRLSDAFETFEANAALLDELTRGDPENTQRRYLRAVSHAKLATILRATGRPAAALEHDRRSVALARNLVAHDPLNLEWKRELAVAHTSVALDLTSLARAGEAIEHASRGAALLRELVESDGTNADWRRQRAAADIASAAAHLERRRYPAVSALTRRAREVLRPLPASPGDREASRLRAECHLIEGHSLAALGNRTAAADAWRAALAEIEPVAANTTRSDLLWAYARALTLSGERDRAVPVFEMLQSHGFRPVDLVRFCREQRCTGEPR